MNDDGRGSKTWVPGLAALPVLCAAMPAQASGAGAVGFVLMIVYGMAAVLLVWLIAGVALVRPSNRARFVLLYVGAVVAFAVVGQIGALGLAANVAWVFPSLALPAVLWREGRRTLASLAFVGFWVALLLASLLLMWWLGA